MKKVLLGLILIICLGVFGYSAYKLIGYGMETKATKEGLDALAELVVDVPELEAGEKITAEEMAAMMMEKYGALYEMNNDFAAWLEAEAIGVNNPVMFTPDDPQYYLRKNFDGEYDIAGMLFIDDRCSLDPENPSMNTIIYGHRMNNGTMFANLGDYKDAEFVEANSLIHFDTLKRSGTYEIFAVIQSKVYSQSSKEFKYYDFIDVKHETAFREALESIQAISLYYNEEKAPVWGDELLTLSTCDYYTSNGRLAVIARRIGD